MVDKYQWLGYILSWNSGYIEDKITEEDWAFGASRPILKEDGQYDNDLPKEEHQKSKYFDSFACTNYGVANAIETVARITLKVVWDKSDSFNAVGSGTVPGRGNSIGNACYDARKGHGMINQEDRPLPVDFRRNDFYAPLTQEQSNKGKEFLTEYNIEYERVMGNQRSMMQALKHSPLIVGGYAWYQKNGYYRSINRANHVFIVYGYVEGVYWKVFDSYPPYNKKLDWNFKFIGVRTIYLEKKNMEYNQSEIDNLIKRGFKYIMRVLGHGEIYELTSNGLKYLSKDEWNDINVKRTADEEKLIGVPEELYLKIIK